MSSLWLLVFGGKMQLRQPEPSASQERLTSIRQRADSKLMEGTCSGKHNCIIAHFALADPVYFGDYPSRGVQPVLRRWRARKQTNDSSTGANRFCAADELFAQDAWFNRKLIILAKNGGGSVADVNKSSAGSRNSDRLRSDRFGDNRRWFVGRVLPDR